MLNVYITSLFWIKQNKEFCKDKAIISITYPNPNYYFPNGQPDEVFPTDDILRLKFSDDDLEEATLLSLEPDEFIPFTIDMAKQVISFVKKAKENNKEIVVHCYAGIIRSATIGIYIGSEFDYQIIAESQELEPLSYALNILNNTYKK